MTWVPNPSLLVSDTGDVSPCCGMERVSALIQACLTKVDVRGQMSAGAGR